jgi:hypothetical protein
MPESSPVGGGGSEPLRGDGGGSSQMRCPGSAPSTASRSPSPFRGEDRCADLFSDPIPPSGVAVGDEETGECRVS